MGFRAYLLYVFMVFVRPIEQFAPEIMAYRPILILWAVTFLASVVEARQRGGGAASRQHFAVLAWLSLVVFVSVLLHSDLSAAMGAFGVISTPAMLFVLTCLNVDTIERFKTLTKLFLGCVVVLCFQGLLAFHQGVNLEMLIIPQLAHENVILPKERPTVPALDDSGAYIWRLRSVGFLNDPNDFAQTIIVVAPWLFMHLPEKASAIWRMILVSPWLALLGYVLTLTHSRGGMLGVAAALLFFFKDRIGKVWAALFGMAGVLAFSLGLVGGDRGLTGKERSASERIDAWNDGIQMLKSDPFLGVGYGNFTEHHERTAHNSFVLCFAELGLLGYFLWIGLIVLAFQALNRIIRCLKSDDAHAQYAVLLRTSFVGFLVCAWFLSRTFVPTLFILMGMTVGLLHSARMRHPQAQVPELHQPLLWRMASAQVVVVTLVLVSMFIRFSR